VRVRSERLLALILTLADGRLHPAPALAVRFGVSERSIYRDMDLLSGMGLPIEALAGRDGGYRVLPGYTLDRSILDEGEVAAVVAALEGLEGIAGGRGGARSKLAALLSKAGPPRPSWIRLELAGLERDRGRIELLRDAIEDRRLVEIAYRDSQGQATRRRVEPVAVVYLWQAWYLWAWCRLREGFRLFKLGRIDSARDLMTRFEPRPEPSPDAWKKEWEFQAPSDLTLEIAPGSAARADEWFGPSPPLADGGRLVRVGLPVNDWLLGFLLSFGPGLKVLEPEGLGLALAERAKAIWESYQGPS
jgi:predicted DNA-binding transcriptional regulator YafY